MQNFSFNNFALNTLVIKITWPYLISIICNGIATGRYINEAAVRCLSTPAAQGP